MLCLNTSTEYSAGQSRDWEEKGEGEFVGAMDQRLVPLKSLQNSKFEYGLSGCHEGILVKRGAQPILFKCVSLIFNF